MRTRSLPSWRLAVPFLVLLTLAALAPDRAEAYTFVVNSSDDVADPSGCDAMHCSLREAILDANSLPGPDRIEFALLGGGLEQRIQILLGPLPAITGDLVIDGYTQPGAAPNTNATGGLNTTIRVHIQGDPSLGSPLGAGFLIAGSQVTIRGLAVTNFHGAFVVNNPGVRDVAIGGNFIGLDSTGVPGTGNFGVILTRTAGVTIGGPLPADRNLISGHNMGGIRLERVSGDPVELTVQGNLIGTQADGSSPSPNHDAIVIDHTNQFPSADDRLLIGGDQEAEGNVIAGSSSGLSVLGMFVSAPGYSMRVINNRFGTDWTGMATLGFTFSALNFAGFTEALVSRNVITNASVSGIRITGSRTMEGRGIAILDNQIYGNGGPGIDLGNDGRTPNDADDSDDGPNARLNYPVLSLAQTDATSGLTRLVVDAQAEPGMRYRLEIFDVGPTIQPDGWQAKRRVYETLVDTNGSGQFSLERHPVLSGITPGHWLSATLTNDTLGYTSEISDSLLVTAADPAIDGRVTLADGVTPVPFVGVTLTGAVTRSTTTGPDGRYLFFDVPPGGAYTVTVSALGYTFATPQVTVPSFTTRTEVDFVAVAEAVPAFTVTVTHDAGDGVCTLAECTLREAIDAANGHPGADTIAFAIPGSGPHTIQIEAPLPDILSDVRLDGYTQPGATPNTRATGGLDTLLQIALAPGATPGAEARGLRIAGDRVTVRGLAIDGFQIGLAVLTAAGAQQVAIEGNLLGTTIDGRESGLPSGRGILLTGNGRASVTIGGATPAARNLIANQALAGIEWSTHDVSHPLTLMVQGNLIGTDIAGATALPNLWGLFTQSGPGATADIIRIGGDDAAAANVIASSAVGIAVERAAAADAAGAALTIAGNFLGVSADRRLLGPMAIAIAVCGDLQAVVRRNTIGDVQYGVTLCPSPAGRVTITENALFNIYVLGIDLGQDGATSNDTGDLDSGPNALQNYPALTSVVEVATGADVTGTFDSTPLRAYRLELFRTGPGWMAERDARELMASFTVETSLSGTASFSQRIGLLDVGERIVATATDLLTGVTSELSPPTPIMSLDRYRISGRLLRGSQPIAQVSVHLTGDRTRTVQTDDDGYFAFLALPATGTYTVTPSDPAWRFTPPLAAVANLQDYEFLTFTAVPSSYTRYFAEGAAGSFWETSFALLNPTSTPVTADVTFMLPDGRTEQLAVPLTGPGHAVIDPSTIPSLNGNTFSTKVFATEAVVASRTMRWGVERELGAHAEQGVSEARTTWYFAEGATGCFDLFYQLGNPNATAAEVEVTFVRRAPDAPVVRTYTIPPYARHTIQANREEGLAFAEVSAKMRVTNGQPIVAERAMYANCFGTSWRGGHDAAGSPAPSTIWRLAEGATGSFFDLYLLLANFEPQAAEVDVEYMLPDGVIITKPYVVPANSRITIDVAGEAPQLAHTAVSAYITSDLPIVAERAQWWPHGAWYEGHASAGAATFGYEWQVAGAQVGGAHALNGYLLIANTGSREGAARVTAVFADGSTATLAEPVRLVKHSRTTIDLAAAFPQAKDQSFGLIVESIGDLPAPIVVELSTYGETPGSQGPHFWGAGTNIGATRIR